MSAARTLPWDWYAGTIPDNVVLEDESYVETTFSFTLFRSSLEGAVRYGPGAHTYLGTMFDVGPAGRVVLGRCALVHGARIICDALVDIGDYALISWNVVLMDTRRFAPDPLRRRAQLQAIGDGARTPPEGEGRPIHIGPNVWIGFDACVLPGVTIGEGAVVGAKSVVDRDVPPYAVVAGNPAGIVRRLEAPRAG